MMMSPKWIARPPHKEKVQYLKYGFVITECMSYFCPRCGCVLNAGPNYQPKYCDQCGQRVDFTEIKWEPDREIGFAERRGEDESVKNRVV